MKIFYAVQATGNGHIARFKELLPSLQKYGTVDIFLSGENCSLNPGFDIAYRSKGLGFFYNNKGGLNYSKTLKALHLNRVWKEAHQLPLEKYDLIINDFESITALACTLKKIPSIGFGHQASFQSSKVPRPKFKNPFGELILKKYAKASHYIGLHFEEYDNFIHFPVIKRSILNAKPSNKGHISVYLSHYGNLEILNAFEQCRDLQFEVFSPKVSTPIEHKNVQFFPIDNKKFSQSVLSSHGVITGAGFETPAEVLSLGKKLICLPIKNQYEQLCNAEALTKFDVPICTDINHLTNEELLQWYHSDQNYTNKKMIAANNDLLIEKVIETSFTSTESAKAMESLQLKDLHSGTNNWATQ